MLFEENYKVISNWNYSTFVIKPDVGRIVCVFDELGEVLFDLLHGERKVGHARQEQVERLRRLFLPNQIILHVLWRHQFKERKNLVFQMFKIHRIRNRIIKKEGKGGGGGTGSLR